MNSLNELHVIMNVDPDTHQISFSVGLGKNNIRTFDTKEEALAELGNILKQIKNQHEDKK